MKEVKMSKKAIKKNEEKTVSLEKKEKEVSPLKAIEEKRNSLMTIVSKNILSKRQIKDGGRIAGDKHLQEVNYRATVEEINELGAELGLPKITLENLRR
jgi:hypothetical protein